MEYAVKKRDMEIHNLEMEVENDLIILFFILSSSDIRVPRYLQDPQAEEGQQVQDDGRWGGEVKWPNNETPSQIWMK